MLSKSSSAFLLGLLLLCAAQGQAPPKATTPEVTELKQELAFTQLEKLLMQRSSIQTAIDGKYMEVCRLFNLPEDEGKCKLDFNTRKATSPAPVKPEADKSTK